MQKLTYFRFSLLLSTVMILSACSSIGNLGSLTSDRQPDYRSSHMEHTLEVPPDLRNTTDSSQYAIPGLNDTATTSYNSYMQQVQRDQRGYIQVLPPLQGVEVIQESGQLPYIIADADPETVWAIVKRYWNQKGIRLTTDDPAIGIMETDWLINEAGLPHTGIGGFLNNLFSFASDSGERDRYRIRFSRDGANRTIITLIYSQSVEKAQHSGIANKDVSGYRWQLSDTAHPELQLEMTRRIALYIAGALKQAAAETKQTVSTVSTQQPLAQLGKTQNGISVLALNLPFEQAWPLLGTALTRAGYTVLNADSAHGVYQIQTQSHTATKAKRHRAIYLVRLATQEAHSLVAIQNTNGSMTATKTAQSLLKAIYTHLR